MRDDQIGSVVLVGSPLWRIGDRAVWKRMRERPAYREIYLTTPPDPCQSIPPTSQKRRSIHTRSTPTLT